MAADGMPADVRIISWDWRAQPDVIEIVGLSHAMRTEHGVVSVYTVDTGSDQYAVCISARPLDDAQIGHLYTRWLEACDE